MESILNSVKKSLGIPEEETHFDPDILMAINGAMLSLLQIGVGNTVGFIVMDSSNTWTDFFGERTDLEAVKVYINTKVKYIFDPPTNQNVLKAMENLMEETIWRIRVQVDPLVVPDVTEEVDS